MTRRERLELVIKGEINEELIEDCKKELEKLDAHRTHARENANAQENKEFEERICAALLQASEPVQIDELAELVGCTFARQRLTAICTNLIREGRILCFKILIFDFVEIIFQAPSHSVENKRFFPRTHPGTCRYFVKNFTSQF